MRVSNAIAEWLRDHGIKHVFCVSGGASLWIIHGIADTEGIEFVCPQHEQAAGYAADAYARLVGAGCALGTSGPGATNLVTAIASSYYDSVPVLYLAGQVTTARMARRYGAVRQFGFQETPIVPMVREITVYAEEPMTAEAVLPTFNNAWHAMHEGRKGPALISVPDDIQRATI